MSPADAFDILRAALEQTGIRYAIGGSWASTAFGEPRFTNDIDILAEVTSDNVVTLLSRLPNTFYADAEEALQALRRGRPFNVIHMPTALKFDLFPSLAFPIGSEELDRAVSLADSGLSKGPAWFVTPEDWEAGHPRCNGGTSWALFAHALRRWIAPISSKLPRGWRFTNSCIGRLALLRLDRSRPQS